jgi:hypothetical protein
MSWIHWQDQSERLHDELTHAAPVEAMCDPVFRLVRVWVHSLVDMEDFGIIMRIAATVVDMHVSPQRRAYQIA